MGLDNFWKKNKDEYGIVKAKLKVCGSMLNDEDANIPEKISFKSIRGIIMQIFGIKKLS